MSKAAKQSLVILIVLLLASLGFAGYMVLEKQKLEEAKLSVETKLKESQEKGDRLFKETRSLKTKIKSLEQDKVRLSGEKANLSKKLRDAERKLDDLYNEISLVKRERDKWKRRLDEAGAEQDKLMERIRSLVREKAEYEKKLVEASRAQKEPEVARAPQVQRKTYQRPVSRSFSEEVRDANDEEYWASVLRQKASLEVEIDQLKQELSEKVMEIVELKRGYDDIKIELETLKHEKEEVQREIKHKNDLINNLSLELARTKNDKKFIADRVAKLNKKNEELRREVKRLISTKGALEKSVVRLTQDKGKIEKELGKTETIIQSKIDEIWDIKESLDQTIKQSQKLLPPKDGIELPPIVVSHHQDQTDVLDGPSTRFVPPKQNFSGRIVSVNKENNFVIVDIGQKAGLRLGDTLNVYRGDRYIARLEVIQLRKDIAAADIKEQKSSVKIGDTIR